MPETAPFHSFSFTLIEGRQPRALFRMRAADEGLYELHVEKGSAANPISKFTRTVPVEVAVRLRDSLQEIGVFSWEESYGDAASPGSRRWNVSTVFKEGVFSVASKGGSDVPAGFDQMLEELYKLDFPRPGGKAAGAAAGNAGAAGSSGIGSPGLTGRAGMADAPGATGAPGIPGMSEALRAMGSFGAGGLGGLSAGDLGAYNAMGGAEGMFGALSSFGSARTKGVDAQAGLGSGAGGGADGVDFSQLADMMKKGGVDGLDPSEMNRLLSDAQRNPQAIQQRMRDEFQHMPHEEQERMLDALASTGMATREWWERFLRG